MTTVLAAECVSKHFGMRQVLSSATLHAVPGQVRGLLGRNGAGKSTLIRIAAGWMQPDGGCVHFDGVAYLKASYTQLARRRLFHLPQHDLLSPAFTVRRQLEMFRRQFRGGDPDEAATLLGIAALLDQRPPTLSGGELRRAELAAAFVREPLCLLADEPFRGISPLDVETLTTAFRALAQRGCAVVVTGHEVNTVMNAIDHVTWCTSGTTYELGPPSVAMTDARFRQEYLPPERARALESVRAY